MRLFSIVSLFLVAVAEVSAAPVINDLWDSSQAGHVSATLVSAAPSGILCGFAGNLFGASLGNGSGGVGPCSPEGAERLIFQDQFFNPPVVNVIEWGTVNTTITSFNLYTAGDGTGNRDLGRLRLFYWDGSSFVDFYDSGVLASPQPTGPSVETDPLLTSTFGAGVTSTLWRAEFTQAPNQSGPRVIELDGFGSVAQTSVPEPSTIGVVAVGLAALLSRRFRRKTCELL